MLWFLPALAAPLFYSLATTFDSVLANRRLPRITVLIVYGNLFTLCYIPFVFLLQPPRLPTLAELPFLIFLGFTSASYLFPYYKALQKTDTSVVLSLFSFTRIFIPLLAFLFVHEVLTVQQYVGFILIVLAATGLSFDPKKFKLNASFWYMLLATLIVSIGAVAQKYTFAEVNIPWGTVFAWQAFFTFAWISPLLLSQSIRKGMKASWPGFKKALPVFTAEEICTFTATGASSFAASIAPITFVTAATMFTPIFALLIGLIGRRWFKESIKEQATPAELRKKILLYALMFAGAVVMAV